jgi:hypothetical protein
MYAWLFLLYGVFSFAVGWFACWFNRKLKRPRMMDVNSMYPSAMTRKMEANAEFARSYGIRTINEYDEARKVAHERAK